MGARCTTCAAVAFPLRRSCLECGGSVERILLPRNGELWTWTTQGFEPKAPYVGEPGEFVPYAVGYVELPGALRIEGLLTESDPARLRIGQAMEVVAIVHGGVRTYAFAPTEPGQ
ncbi:MAG TPA: OB-fold domain-containing protein [Gaiellaceae bacterium]|nr:OB-fold domain-containing protein [Gaiellaceae bacterium]